MIYLAEKNHCTGCAACYNACPKSAISMLPDNGGFLYPYINDELCIKCNQCSKSCPVISPLIQISEYEPRAFVAQHKDDDIRKESTSGGAFTALAQIVIENGGVVFGASMEDGFVVKHTLAATIDELAKFRNSKYVQSEIGKSFSVVKEYLEKGIQVLFSGTPCQIEGLLGYLHIKYNNLITVDIVCHSIPSPAVFKKYMDLQISKYPQVDKVVFRDKQWGYDYSTIALYGKKKTDDKKCFYRRGSESDLWFRSFLPGLCDRENCYNCYFQEYPRKSDITIWDCFTISDIYPEFDDNNGTTSVMVWSLSGISLLDNNPHIMLHEISPKIFVSKIHRDCPKKLQTNREKMYGDLDKMSPSEFFRKYRKKTLKINIKQYGRTLLFHLGLHSSLKKLIKKKDNVL